MMRNALENRTTTGETWADVLRNDRWVAPYFRQYKRVLRLALGLGALAALLACVLMFVSGWLIGAAARMPETIFVLLIPIGIVQVVGISKPIVGYFERLASHDWVLRMTSSLRRRLFLAFEREAAGEGPARGYGAEAGGEAAVLGAGDALALLNEDIGRVQNLYLRCVFPMVTAWAVVIVAVIAVGVMDPLFAAWFLLELFVCVAVLPVAALAAGARARLRRKRATATLYQSLTDAVLGAADVAFAGRADDVLARFTREAAAVSAEDRRLARLDRAQGILLRAVLAAAAVGLTVWAAGALGDEANAILAAVICFFPLVEAIAPVPDAAAQLPDHAAAIRRLAPLDDGEGAAASPRVGGTDGGVLAASPRNPASPQGRNDADAATPPQVDGTNVDAALDAPGRSSAPAIRLDGVTFAYPGSAQLALDGLDLSVAPGERIALLGRSGAGKSTLIGLVCGDLEPQGGAAELNGAPHPGPDAACELIGVISQDPHVFNTTVLDNLRIARAATTEDEAWDVLERVGLRERVERFPDGVMSVVGEEGRLLSGGERHRLALARILLADTPIVILDEPFVGLDPATERSVLDAVLDALAGRTLLMVTHHLQGVERMDRVAFLEDGRFALMGAPADLERTSARYRRLLDADRGLAG
ncbi:MAG: thiol reductant ABC exporter subunit CydC [Collinsella sp.]|nr:thiol reductant ABC exporter subunit CydC [Collinsella sp.]